MERLDLYFARGNESPTYINDKGSEYPVDFLQLHQIHQKVVLTTSYRMNSRKVESKMVFRDIKPETLDEIARWWIGVRKGGALGEIEQLQTQYKAMEEAGRQMMALLVQAEAIGKVEGEVANPLFEYLKYVSNVLKEAYETLEDKIYYQHAWSEGKDG